MIKLNSMNSTVGTERRRQKDLNEVSHADRPSRGILVVDDEPLLRGLLKTVLGRQGFAVWLAANGVQAIDLCQQHHDSIHVGLLDVRMPGLDGPQTMAALQEIKPKLPFCFMTGDPGIYQISDLLARGARYVFRKPFQLDEINKVVYSLAYDTLGEAQEISPHD